MSAWLIFVRAPIAAVVRWMRRLLGRGDAASAARASGEIPNAVIERLRERYPDAPLPWLEIVARNAPREKEEKAGFETDKGQRGDFSAASAAKAPFKHARVVADRSASKQDFGVTDHANLGPTHRGTSPRFVLKSIERLEPRRPFERLRASASSAAERAGEPSDAAHGWDSTRRAHSAASRPMPVDQPRRGVDDRPSALFDAGAAVGPPHGTIGGSRFAQESAPRASSGAIGVRELHWSPGLGRAAEAAAPSPLRSARPRAPVSDMPPLSPVDAARGDKPPEPKRGILERARGYESAASLWSDRPSGDLWPALAEEPAETAAAPHSDHDRGRRLARIQEAL
ncbi:hypothetical protein [Methylocapsa acidiphila]|uniref:hypothetical protein n=1 Tax=Methylocapsa acidiphila TaxID=133552 RepID=UPI0003FCB2A8|nr:hypothetical protein [Methylocapsa acidiphila]